MRLFQKSRLFAILGLSVSGIVTISGATVRPANICKPIQGHLEETLFVNGCTSPVALCTVAQMTGDLKGEARFAATAFIPSNDTPTTGVIFVIGDTLVVNASLEHNRGSLF